MLWVEATLFSTQSIAHNFGPSLRWNILYVGRITNDIRYREAIFDEAVTGYRKTVLLAFEEVENLLVNYVREKERAEHLRRGVEAIRQSVTMADALYRRGLVSMNSVLDTQRSLYDLQKQHIDSRANIVLFQIALYRALGGGWQSALATRQACNRQNTAGPPPGAVYVEELPEAVDAATRRR